MQQENDNRTSHPTEMNTKVQILPTLMMTRGSDARYGFNLEQAQREFGRTPSASSEDAEQGEFVMPQTRLTQPRLRTRVSFFQTFKSTAGTSSRYHAGN
eukprot:2495794-Rhodomonas_salina.1